MLTTDLHLVPKFRLSGAIPVVLNYAFVLYTGTLHDHPSSLCFPNALSLVGDPLSGNGCGSPNHIWF